MTDYEMILSLCEKLGLTEVNAKDRTGDPGKKEYIIFKSETLNKIVMGSGYGYSGFVCEFDFDSENNLIGHGVFE